NVVVMEAVAAGTKHRVKLLAGASERSRKEGLLARRSAPPGIGHGNDRTVRQAEGADIERIAKGVLRDAAPIVAVSAAAAIRGDLADLDDAAAEIAVGSGLHRGLDPAIERGGERAANCRRRRDGDATVRETRNAQWAFEPAHPGTVDGLHWSDIGRGVYRAAGEAGLLDLATPRCALAGIEIAAGAAEQRAKARGYGEAAPDVRHHTSRRRRSARTAASSPLGRRIPVRHNLHSRPARRLSR